VTSPKKPGTPSNSSGAAVWIGVGAVIVVLGVIAVFLARGSGGDDEPVENQTGSVSVGDSSTTAAEGETSTPGKESGALPEYDASTSTDPAVGMTIPTVTGQDFAGDDLTITGDDGKAKVIVFVAHWCPHCQREVPVLTEHLADAPMPDDVELLTVSTSVQPGAENYPPQEWLDEEGWPAPVLADDEASTVAQAFGLSSFPYFVAVDADGKVVERASGELTTDQFDALVAAAQEGTA
jgi:cytochrome c biogenesis protein CcmG/thiol:disulfide interchange protein DsbE